MKQLFDKVSARTSKVVTRTYSTSFSLGIFCLDKKMHEAIYGIYGFVRLADEIVDSFHDFDKKALLEEFKKDTWLSIERGISLNPVLNSFQQVVNHYKIEHDLITCFLSSMEADLTQQFHDRESFNTYILGSAEVVGLMCLHVFTENNKALYRHLKPSAMRLGAAFQKVNFLRDMRADLLHLGRAYFPDVDMTRFSQFDKLRIEAEIEEDFKEALKGIKQLPRSSKFGVYVAYVYYYSLFRKIKETSHSNIMSARIRISNPRKLGLLATTYLRHNMNLL